MKTLGYRPTNKIQINSTQQGTKADHYHISYVITAVQIKDNIA